MNDLISRQAAIDTLKDMYQAAEKWGQEAKDDVIKVRAESCMASLVEVKLRIENLPPAQPEQKWIPVSERLPEVGERVVICFRAGSGCPFDRFETGHLGTHDVEDNFFRKVGVARVWYTSRMYFQFDSVIAWMPLPEPPKEEQDADGT